MEAWEGAGMIEIGDNLQTVLIVTVIVCGIAWFIWVVMRGLE